MGVIQRSPRIFLVGCPRSGTTLLQAMLAAHPEIASFPETHFFPSLVGMPEYRQFGELPQGVGKRWKFLRRMLLSQLGFARRAGRRSRKRLEQFLVETGMDDVRASLGPRSRTIRGCTVEFLDVLDAFASKQGKRLWVEKTPHNMHYIDVIERYVPEARFIHLVREGADNVASLYGAAKKYGHPWEREYSTVERCVERWLLCARETLKHVSKENHFAVRFEELAKDPRAILTNVCGFIGIAYDGSMLENYREAAKVLVLGREPWKASVVGSIRKPDSAKYLRLFDDEHRRRILERLAAVDLSALGKGNSRARATGDETAARRRDACRVDGAVSR